MNFQQLVHAGSLISQWPLALKSWFILFQAASPTLPSPPPASAVTSATLPPPDKEKKLRNLKKVFDGNLYHYNLIFIL